MTEPHPLVTGTQDYMTFREHFLVNGWMVRQLYATGYAGRDFFSVYCPHREGEQLYMRLARLGTMNHFRTLDQAAAAAVAASILGTSVIH